jgi:hypothetical protein
MKNSIESQSNIKLVTKSKKQKEFYVYHDEYNGNIIEISSRKIEHSQYPYIIDNSGICPDILAGKSSIGKFTIGYENYEKDTLSLLLKTKLVNFIKKQAELYTVPVSEKQKGIAFIYYKNSHLLEVVFDNIVIGNYNDTLWQQQFQLAFDEKFIIYLVDKQNPDILYGQYGFPMGDIFEEGVLLITDFHQFDPEIMDICTKRHFREYSLILRDTFIETDFHKDKLGRISMINKSIKDDSSHIELIQTKEERVENGIWMGFKVDIISQLADKTHVSQFEKTLKFYICDSEDPDSYEDSIEFEWNDLIPKKKSYFYMPSNLDEKSIFYNGNKIKISLREKNNESTNN